MTLATSKRAREVFKIPARYSHFAFGILQSGLTCAIAAAISCGPLLYQGAFVSHWLRSWLFSWLTMFPVVLLAAPAIRRAVKYITR
ncbi:DUF2798 domain-containing protein [Cupriavidus sp. 8B]